MQIADELVLSTRLPTGANSYTLTTRLSQMLCEAEGLYGKRDQTFTILGVEFSDGGPQIWFPHDRKDVAIRLDPVCLTDPTLAYFQLAQEVVHLLDPCTGTANNLEEGVATDFAISFLSKEFAGQDWKARFSEQSYRTCGEAVKELLAIRPDFVRRMRRIKPLSQASQEDILTLCSNCSVDTARFLAMRFK